MQINFHKMQTQEGDYEPVRPTIKNVQDNNRPRITSQQQTSRSTANSTSIGRAFQTLTQRMSLQKGVLTAVLTERKTKLHSTVRTSYGQWH